MEAKEHKFRFRLNLFDGIILLCAVLAAGFLLWNRFKPAAVTPSAPTQSEFHYTICLEKVLEGLGEQIEPGADLTDSIKNYDLGQVTAVRVEPGTESIINEETESYVTALIPGCENVYLDVAAQASVSKQSVVVGGGYEVRVGDEIFVRGPGFLGSGKVVAMERGE